MIKNGRKERFVASDFPTKCFSHESLLRKLTFHSEKLKAGQVKDLLIAIDADNQLFVFACSIAQLRRETKYMQAWLSAALVKDLQGKDNIQEICDDWYEYLKGSLQLL